MDGRIFGSPPIYYLKEGFALAQTMDYPAKIQLFRQGTLVDSVYTVVSGIIKLSCVDLEGKEIIVGLRSSGWLLGATSFILNQPHQTTATTLTRCQLARISANEFGNVLGAESQFSRYLHAHQAREVEGHLNNLVELASRPTRCRLAKLLSDVAFGLQSPGSNSIGILKIPLKQWEIAELLAITPEHTCRVLGGLEEAGLVRREGKHLIIPDLERLLSFADADSSAA